MGLGRMLLFGDWGLRWDMDEIEEDVRALKRELNVGVRRDMSLKDAAGQLMHENLQLRLYFVSLVRLLTAKGVISKEELTAMVKAIDAEDGCVDGRYSGKSVFPQQDDA